MSLQAIFQNINAKHAKEATKERIKEVSWKNKTMYKVEDEELYDAIFRKILFWWGLGNNKLAKFPSPLPVSMSFEEIQDIRASWEDWWMSEKTNGEHYILYFGHVLGQPVQAILQRNLDIHLVTFEVPHALFSGTLLEGEWIKDKFLVFDVISSCGYVTRYLRFTDRLKIMHNLIPLVRPVDSSPFQLQAKVFVPISSFRKYLENWSKVGHSSDGFIFIYSPYCLLPKSHSKLLKWKPPHLLTVDFYLEENGDQVDFLVFHKNAPHVFTSQPSFGDGKSDGGIWECRFDSSKSLWIPLHQRTDKTFPNSLYVANKTWQHIMDNVSLSVLCDYWFPNDPSPSITFT